MFEVQGGSEIRKIQQVRDVRLIIQTTNAVGQINTDESSCEAVIAFSVVKMPDGSSAVQVTGSMSPKHAMKLIHDIPLILEQFRQEYIKSL